jgi:hypothetical protein
VGGGVEEVDLVDVEQLADVCLTPAVLGPGARTQPDSYRPLWASVQSAHEVSVLVTKTETEHDEPATASAQPFKAEREVFVVFDDLRLLGRFALCDE